MSGRGRLLLPLLGPLVLLGMWAAAAWVWPDARALPGPRAVLRAAAAELPRAAIWRDALATLGRVVAGVAIAVAVGAPLGFLLGRSRRGWRAAEPTVDFARAIPPILTFPIFLFALGYGDASRIAAVAAGSALLVTFHVGAALARIPEERRDAVRLAGLRGLRAFTHLHFFEALPALLLGLRLAVAAGLVIAVVTEMLVGAPTGLGARALAAQIGYRADLLWLVMLLAGAVGMALSGAIAALERALVHWSR